MNHLLWTVLLRNLPRHYTYNSIYGLFPFTLPATTSKALADAQVYDMERPAIRKTTTLNTLTAIRHVLNNPTTYPTSYGRDLKSLTNGYGCVGRYCELVIFTNSFCAATSWALTTRRCELTSERFIPFPIQVPLPQP